MKKPTKSQIESEIKKLTEIKPKIPRTTYFGDNNHDAIEAQLTTLRERLSEDDVMDRTQFEDEDEDEDDSKWSQHAGESARYAAQWLEGEEEESPSKSWKSLAKP